VTKQQTVTEREARRRDRQRNSPTPSRRPSFLNELAVPTTTPSAVGPESAGAQNVVLDPRPPPKQYLTAAQLRARYGGVSHMWVVRRLRYDPTFPRPIKLGGSLIRMWALDEIEAWERSCVVNQRRGSGHGR
jgi:predicted DNA-binding transcriptional regulator AlpA